MNAQLSVISIHGGTISEDYLERINLCEFCGDEVITNGNTRSVRTFDPQSRDPNPRLIKRISHYVQKHYLPPIYTLGHTQTNETRVVHRPTLKRVTALSAQPWIVQTLTLSAVSMANLAQHVLSTAGVKRWPWKFEIRFDLLLMSCQAPADGGHTCCEFKRCSRMV